MLHVLTYITIFTLRGCGGSRCTCRRWSWCRHCRCRRCGCGGGGCGTGRCFYRTTIIIYRCKIMSFYDTNFPYNVSKS